jgi:putative spermidine/putrescine transport system ATP-binding protein
MTTIDRPASAATTSTSSAPTDRPALALRDLRKMFGNAVAVDGIDLDVRRGEFLTLLGPSGSGKTTTLRMVAGFMAPTAGSIEIDGTDMTRVPPYRRDVGMVFQNYALFPHMTAADNVAFPLRMRRRPSAEIKKRVADALELVKLGGYGDRYPRQLSGGQQQRIALARAVVFEPRRLLMDEPLGALDRKLRESLQLEIIRVSRELGATVLYVTHDQEEALVMSDRIAIFSAGRIEQLGSGEDLYDRPASLFVADFIGESNILRGRYEAPNGDGADGGWMTRDDGRWRVGRAAAARAELASGSAAALVVRPERVKIIDGGTGADGLNVVDATVDEVLYLGPDTKYQLALRNGQRMAVREPREGSGRELQRGDHVRLGWAVEDGLLVADPASS